MVGWIVFNGALKYNKTETLVNKLIDDATKENIELIKVKNNEILAISPNKLLKLKNLKEPNFILFWDKDIKLCKHLEFMGYKVFNNHKAIKVCDNKGLMHLKFNEKNVPTPKTILGPYVYHSQVLGDKYIQKIFSELGTPFVLKECYGSFGMGVYLVNSKLEFLNIVHNLKNKEFIIQKFIKESRGMDIRVNIIGNEVIGAIKRTSKDDFRANITLGGVGTPYNLSKEEADLALLAHKSLGLDFSGVDLLFGENGPIICEVNSNVNFLSFEKATGINFGKKLLEHILKNIM
ncbi:MAG: RimK family alpha-L-glutamate ligase [Lachnospirales bacterium]